MILMKIPRYIETPYTLLHAACKWGDVKLVEHLLRIGFNPEAKNDGGFTPLDYATLNRKKECIQCLIATDISKECKNFFGIRII